MRAKLQAGFQHCEVLDWNESVEGESVYQFHDKISALNFLRQFLRDPTSMATIRRLLAKVTYCGNITESTNPQVLEQLAVQLVLGRLRIVIQPYFERGATASGFLRESDGEKEFSKEAYIKPPGKSKQEADFAREKKAWIEIMLLDGMNRPVAGEFYRIILPDQKTIREGKTDLKGLARETGIDPGTCKVTFPNLEKDVWAYAQ